MTRTGRRRACSLAVGGALLLGLTAASSGFVQANATTPPVSGSDSDSDATLNSKQSELQKALKQAQGDLDEASGATRAARLKLADTAAKLPVAQQAYNHATGVYVGATQLADATRAELTTAQQAVDVGVAAVNAAQKTLSDKEKTVGSFARNAYESGPTGLAAGWLSATDPDAIVDQKAATAGTANQMHAALLAVDGAQITLSQKQADLKAKRDSVAAKLTVLEQAEVTAKQAQDAAQTAAQQLADLKSQQQVALTDAKSAEAQDQQQAATLQASSNQITQILKDHAAQRAAAAAAASRSAAAASASRAAAAAAASQAAGSGSGSGSGGSGSTAPPAPAPTGGGSVGTPSKGGLIYPVTPVIITSGYGYRTDPVTGAYVGFHPGVDFAAPTGTPIHAATSGTIVYAGWEEGYGNYTCIARDEHFATCYGHQSAIYVHVGQSVSQGQTIGAVGSTGYSTGPHCHFEVRIDGNVTDPMPYL